MRNVYICEIFSCYSGYQSVFLLELCTFSQPNKRVGFKRTTTLHILHSTHLCQHVVPCTIHRTATGAGNATSHHVPLPWKKGGELRGGGKRPNNHQRKQGRLDTERVPCITGSYGVQSKCNKEGQDNNLLVAMKQEVCARSLLAVREGKKTEGKEKSIFRQTKIILSLI